MASQTGTAETAFLLTPTEAAQRLLEEATRAAFRTGGISGLRPVRVNGRPLFRSDDVDAFARSTLAAM